MASKDAEKASDSSDEDAQSGSAFRSYLRVFTYSDRIGWLMNGVAAFCMVAAGAMLPLMDLIFGQFVTVFNDFSVGASSPEHFRSEINKFTLYFVYLFVAKFALTYAWTFLISTNAVRTTKNLRIDFVRQTLRQEMAFFDAAAGSMSGSVTTHCNLVGQGVSEKLGLAVQAVATFVAAFAVAFAVQWKLTLITLGIVPAIVVVTGVCAGIDVGHEDLIMGIYARAGRLAEEVFASVRTAHAFGAYGRLSRKYGAMLDEAHVVARKRSANYAVLFSVEFFSIYCGYGLAFWQGFRLYDRGEVAQPGQVVTVIFAVVVAAQALTQIAPQTVTIAKAAAAAHELFRTIDRRSHIDALSDEGLRPAACRGNLEFKGVSFAYPSRPDVEVLRELDLAVPADKTTAIVGASGSGKSTVVGLIERWFEAGAGTVTLDGTPIDEYNVRWLRTTIRLVQQEPVLFSGTIFENVAFGLAGTPMADLGEEQKRELVEEACQSAYAQEFIDRLPRGYDTQVGERGATLSGGQKQRIAIARSVVSNPRVLLLDEATSALDPKAERVVQRALDNVAVGRTMLVIAHRLSTVRDADNIVVMSAGQVVEQGTHSQLVEGGGPYSRLVRAQDLGSGRGEQDAEDEQDEQVEGQTEQPEGHDEGQDEGRYRQDDTADATPDATNYGLLKCIAIIMGEQRDLWPVAGVIGLSCVVGGATYPALAVVFARVMDAFALSGAAMVARGDFYSLMFLVIALGNLAAYALMGWFTNVLGSEVVRRYRLEAFGSVLRQEMAFFDRAGNAAGALASRVSTEPAALQELLSFNVGLVLIVVVELASSCVLALATGWKLGLVLVFGALPPLVGAGYARIRLETKLDEATAARFAGSAAVAAEAAMAARTVASLALEEVVLGRYAKQLGGVASKSARALVATMLWYALSQSVSFLCMALGFWYGGRLVSTGEYGADKFYVVFVAVLFSGEAAALFFQFSTSISRARTAANYLLTLRAGVPKDLDEDDDHREKSDRREENNQKEEKGKAVECRDVEFSYPQRPQTRVLRGVSTGVVEPGRFVALVGASGCGKTTVISLLERFYEPTSGKILVDGADARSTGRGRYRRGIALVQQEPVLYQGSIRDNVALGGADSRVSDEEVEEACRKANIWELVASLPEGLDTECGSQGLALSGGQRQRIAIARALVRRPGLLLLDEATSSLDTESERAVQAALAAVAGGSRTTVAVAHRLSTVRHADAILVFARGHIVEAGSHEELWGRRGVYHDMCLGQSLEAAS